MITFVVGGEEKTFHLHAAIIGKHSKVLSAMLEGNFREVKERRVVMSDLEVDTFVHFCQYMYAGQYQVSGNTPTGFSTMERDPASDKLSDQVPSTASVASDLNKISYGVKKENHSPLGLFNFHPDREGLTVRSGSTTRPMATPRRTGFGQSTSSQLDWHQASSKPGMRPSESLTWNLIHTQNCRLFAPDSWLLHRQALLLDFFRDDNPADWVQNDMLAHAKLYVFADRYDISDLCALTLNKLYTALHSSPTTMPWCQVVVEVARFCYENTVASNVNGVRNPRMLFSLYMAFHVKMFNQVPEFRKLLVEVGEFAEDLVGHIAELGK